MSNFMRISVIIPVYSEEEVLRKTVESVISILGSKLYEIIIVVAPKSSEKTFLICKELVSTYSFLKFFIQTQNPGLGLALREAFAKVTGTHAVMIDGDGEFELAALPKMIKKAEEGDEVVIASRWMKGGRVYDYDPLTYILNRGFQYIFRLLFWTNIHDLTYGYKLVDVNILKRFKWEGRSHEIAMETTLRPLKAGYRIAEVPSIWRKRQEGVSKITTWKRFGYVPFALKIWLGQYKKQPNE